MRPGRLPGLLLLLFLTWSTSFPQAAWETVAGGPSAEHSPLCVAVIDSLNAVVGGWGGRIFRTTDGGITWMTSPSGSTDNFEAISFADRMHGTIVGGTQSTILRTDDGGATWRRQTSEEFTYSESFSSVSFSDSMNGAVVPWSFGRIYHTSDGGETWVAATPPLSRGLQRVRLRGAYGLAVGYIGDTYRTTDAGERWFFHSANTGGWALRDVHLADSLNAIAVGDGGVIRRTTDGGIFWTVIPSGTTLNFRSIVFSDELHGLIGTDKGFVLRTTDGGLSWSSPEATPMNTVWNMDFSSRFGMSVTRFDGHIFRTDDAGVTWDSLEYSYRNPYADVFALNADSLYCVGEGGRIVFSGDNGRSLQVQPSPVTSSLRRIRFTDHAHGWIVGDSGVVLSTSDGGADWTRKEANTTGNLYALSLPGEQAAFVAGENNTIVRTTDGGSAWTPAPGPVFDHWIALSFLTPAEGVAAGRNGTLIRTTDGGDSWNIIHSVDGLEDVQYLDIDHIYAVGTLPGDSVQRLITSGDGGATWDSRVLTGWEVRRMSFAGPASGILAGTGGVITTQDSGKHWAANWPSMASFNSVSTAGPRAAFAVGDSGVIARMRNTGSITGICYLDVNSDSVRNPGETGLGGRVMYLNGPFADSVVTGADGLYTFTSLPHGSYTVRAQNTLFWEQTAPPIFTSDTLKLGTTSEHLVYGDIGLAGPTVHLRIPIFISDNFIAHRFIWGGIRPGTARGIWGTDPGSTMADYVEGEVELPPRSFVRLSGIYDARFTDPDLALEVPSATFGEGSWTDMRPYTSPSQRDTFLISFLPGYNNGGNYPMTLRWRKDLVAEWFAGPVTLLDPFGRETDMKSTGTLTITERAIESLLMVTNGPNFPDAYLTKWRLVSLPVPGPGGRVDSLFPSAYSRAYSYLPGTGYEGHDSVQAGTGYWLKYPPAIDTLDFDPAARRSDTISLSTGWNLIGSLSAPIPADRLRSIPDSLFGGVVYGFGDAYEAADTLFPGAGYWVYANGAGSLVLDADSPGGAVPALTLSGLRRELDVMESVRFEDADGRAARIFFSGDGPADLSRYALPPRPPEGVFDVRFGAGRSVERAVTGQPSVFRVLISSPKFPLKVSLAGKTGIALSIRTGEELLRISAGSPVVIPSAGYLGTDGAGDRHVMTLTLSEDAGIPVDYALMQNYPNPFNPSTTIRYELPAASHLKIKIFDVVGREIAAPFDGVAEAGYGSVRWDSRGLSSGVYFYRMEAVSVVEPSRTFSYVRKMVVIR